MVKTTICSPNQPLDPQVSNPHGTYLPIKFHDYSLLFSDEAAIIISSVNLRTQDIQKSLLDRIFDEMRRVKEEHVTIQTETHIIDKDH